MKKTTVYLPDGLKERLATAAEVEARSEADIIRDAITAAVDRLTAPEPHIPLTTRGLGDATASERTDELLDGFGR
jgi:predicted transcriptional regulator